MPTINRNKLGAWSRKKQSTKDSYQKWTKYYHNPQWLGERDYYLRMHPLCECCMKHGRIVPAEHVHHKVPFGRGRDEEHKLQLLTNPKNFMSICKKCHGALHKKDNIKTCMSLDYLTDEEYAEAHDLKWIK